MTYGSLFAGIGGLDLGLDRAGMECRWQVEKDDYALRVLGKHWPDVPKYRDVRYFLGSKRWRRAREAWSVDLICGGFPCQDISNAGKRAGIDGQRSGLWSEFARVVRLLRPRYVLVENVAALLGRGMGRVLGDLAACGYDAEWDCIPAAAIGAPHRRDRVWIVAHTSFGGCQTGTGLRRNGEPRGRRKPSGCDQEPGGLADAIGNRLEGHLQDIDCRPSCLGIDARGSLARASEQNRREQWGTEPAVGRVAHGIPHRVDRLRGLGNAVVPQVAEWLGRRILESDR